jgi:CheY-like chemotaxis protein
MKVLVVEDDSLIGLDMMMLLEDRGHAVLGPYPSAAEALASLQQDKPDFALLDVNLGGEETSLPVAEALRQAGVSFAFLTGYNRARLAETDLVSGATVLRKPVSEADLDAVLGSRAAAR